MAINWKPVLDAVVESIRVAPFKQHLAPMERLHVQVVHAVPIAVPIEPDVAGTIRGPLTGDAGPTTLPVGQITGIPLLLGNEDGYATLSFPESLEQELSATIDAVLELTGELHAMIPRVFVRAAYELRTPEAPGEPSVPRAAQVNPTELNGVTNTLDVSILPLPSITPAHEFAPTEKLELVVKVHVAIAPAGATSPSRPPSGESEPTSPRPVRNPGDGPGINRPPLDINAVDVIGFVGDEGVGPNFNPPPVELDEVPFLLDFEFAREFVFPIEIEPIRVPAISVMTQHPPRNANGKLQNPGKVLAMLPGISKEVSINDVIASLNALADAVDLLATFVAFGSAGQFRDLVITLRDVFRLSRNPQVAIGAVGEMSDFNEIDDYISWIAVIGPSGSKVTVWDGEDFEAEIDFDFLGFGPDGFSLGVTCYDLKYDGSSDSRPLGIGMGAFRLTGVQDNEVESAAWELSGLPAVV